MGAGRTGPRGAEVAGGPDARSAADRRRAAAAARRVRRHRRGHLPDRPRFDGLLRRPAAAQHERHLCHLHRIRPPGPHRGAGRPARRRSDDNPPPPNASSCSQGQPQGMLGVRIKDGAITNCGVVNGMDNETCHLSAADTKALMALPVYEPSAHQRPPWSSTKSSASLTSLDGDYRLTAVTGQDGDVLITGLPLSSVEQRAGPGGARRADRLPQRAAAGRRAGHGTGAAVPAAAAPGGRHGDHGDRAAA